MMTLTDIHHVVVGGGKNLVCHWPSMGGIWHWGDEMLVGYIEAHCEYKDRQEVSHALDGIWARAYMRLRRSRDGGVLWEDDGKVFDNSVSEETITREAPPVASILPATEWWNLGSFSNPLWCPMLRVMLRVVDFRGVFLGSIFPG